MHTNNPCYWFRAKRYGLGWGLPLTWQGWVVFLSWLLIVPLGVWFLTPSGKAVRGAFIGTMVVILLVICYWKGDPAGRRWQSGNDN